MDLIRQSGAHDAVHAGIIRQSQENTKYKIFYLTKPAFGPTPCLEARRAWPTLWAVVASARPDKALRLQSFAEIAKSKGSSNGQDRFSRDLAG
jgi:hypothetical protein